MTTQHTPKCVKNYSDNKVSYNCPSNSNFVISIINIIIKLGSYVWYIEELNVAICDVVCQ